MPKSAPAMFHKLRVPPRRCALH